MKLKDVLDKIVVGDAEIQTYNSLAQPIRLGVAEVLSERLSWKAGSAVDIPADTLPITTFEDTPATCATLSRLTEWITPFDLKMSQTLFGFSVERVAIHPRAIIQRARDIIEELGEERMSEYAKQYQIEPDLLARHFRDEAALQLLVIGTMSDSQLEQKDDPEILDRAIALAVANWRK